jgi:acetyltransferase-like isoleucine patch superfamily enzyme
MATLRDVTVFVGDGGHYVDIINDILTTGTIQHYPHHSEWARQYAFLPDPTYICINDPRLRSQVADELQLQDEPWAHSDTLFGPECEWDYGTHINYGVTMTRTTIGHHCTISPGVTICGDVVIGDRVLVGAGATICDRVHIGNDATIGAGAVVLPETQIPDGETWVGVPARHRSPRGFHTEITWEAGSDGSV